MTYRAGWRHGISPRTERFAVSASKAALQQLSEVVRSGLRCCRRRRIAPRFQAMLHAAEAEADREGAVAVDDVLAEADGIIDAGR